MDQFMHAALEEARKGLAEGGIPIGAVLVIDGKIVGRGHNQRVQKDSVILHAEMDCFENAGRLRTADYSRAVMYTSLSPCDMCAGAMLLYGISKLVIGENYTHQGPAEAYLQQRGVEVEILNEPECIQLMQDWVKTHADLWLEDTGR